MSDIRAFVRSFMTISFCFGSMISVNAQVLVHEEPKHHPVLVNDKIRILDVVMASGDSSVYHIHHTPSLFIFFTNSTTGSMLLGKQPSVGKTTAGDLLYEDLSDPNTRTHRVWNMGKDTFHVMDIELLSKQPEFKKPALKLPKLALAIDTSYVRAYRLDLGKGESFELKKSAGDLVLVSFHHAAVETRNGELALAPGGFMELKDGEPFTIRNIGDAGASFTLIELTGQ